MTSRNGIRHRLFAASLALGATGMGFTAFSPEVLAAWVETELEKRPGVTPLAAVDSAERAAVRARAAVSALWPKDRARAEAIVGDLAGRASVGARVAAAAALGRILELAAPVDRIELVCRWTISERLGERIAVARALALPTPVFVADLAIEQLARDASPEVRHATVHALVAHFDEDPAGFTRTAELLASDADAAVASAARDLLAPLSS